MSIELKQYTETEILSTGLFVPYDQNPHYWVRMTGTNLLFFYKDVAENHPSVLSRFFVIEGETGDSCFKVKNQFRGTELVSDGSLGYYLKVPLEYMLCKFPVEITSKIIKLSKMNIGT